MQTKWVFKNSFTEVGCIQTNEKWGHVTSEKTFRKIETTFPKQSLNIQRIYVGVALTSYNRHANKMSV